LDILARRRVQEYISKDFMRIRRNYNMVGRMEEDCITDFITWIRITFNKFMISDYFYPSLFTYSIVLSRVWPAHVSD